MNGIETVERLFTVWLDSAELWEWGIAAATLLLALIFRRGLASVIIKPLAILSQRTKSELDDRVVEAIKPPLAAAVVLAGIYFALSIVPPPVEPVDVSGFFYSVMSVATGLVVVYSLHRLSYVVAQLMDHLFTRSDPTHRGSFLSPLHRFMAITVWLLGGAMIAQNAGYEVSTLLTGIGIGGAALALAAKDTLSHFFGSLTLLFDKPFRVGDRIELSGDIDGIVEEIGFRSTKVRNYDRAIVVLPNNELANKSIKNWADMDKRRVRQTIGVTYDATPSQMEEVVDGIEKILKNDPLVNQDFMAVRFTEFGPSSLDIMVLYYTTPTDLVGHSSVVQANNLKIMKLLTERGLDFAFPTRTVHLEQSD